MDQNSYFVNVAVIVCYLSGWLKMAIDFKAELLELILILITMVLIQKLY